MWSCLFVHVNIAQGIWIQWQLFGTLTRKQPEAPAKDGKYICYLLLITFRSRFGALCWRFCLTFSSTMLEMTMKLQPSLSKMKQPQPRLPAVDFQLQQSFIFSSPPAGDGRAAGWCAGGGGGGEEEASSLGFCWGEEGGRSWIGSGPNWAQYLTVFFCFASSPFAL